MTVHQFAVGGAAIREDAGPVESSFGPVPATGCSAPPAVQFASSRAVDSRHADTGVEAVPSPPGVSPNPARLDALSPVMTEGITQLIKQINGDH